LFACEFGVELVEPVVPAGGGAGFHFDDEAGDAGDVAAVFVFAFAGAGFGVGVAVVDEPADGLPDGLPVLLGVVAAQRWALQS